MEDQITHIRLEQVSKHYNSPKGSYPVLSDITFSFQRGSFNVILGESGSGKTTLLKLIGGLLQPTLGHVYFKNQALDQLSFSDLAAIRRDHFGFMFQEVGLLEHLTGRENICFPRLQSNDALVLEIGEYFGITHCLEKYPAEMSLGERQRVILSRALIGKPECIIADEPTANLDWTNARKSMELLKQYAIQGITIFVATHDERICEFATRVLKIEKEKKSHENNS